MVGVALVPVDPLWPVRPAGVWPLAPAWSWPNTPGTVREAVDALVLGDVALPLVAVSGVGLLWTAYLRYGAHALAGERS